MPPPPPQPAYEAPANFQPPAAPDYVQPYLQQQQPYAAQQPASFGARGVGGAAGLTSQFTGSAGWSCICGVVTIVAPFIVHWVFYLLAIVGLIYGVQAIRRGQLIGGGVGIVLNVIGGLLTIILLRAG